MNIIGFSGVAGSGKNVISDILHAKYNYVVMGLADPIKRLVRDLHHFTDDQLFGASENRNIIDDRYGFSPRDAIKKYGTAARELYKNTWIDMLIDDISTLTDGHAYYTQKVGIYTPQKHITIGGIAVSDLRYLNEMDAVRNIGGKIIRVIRPGAGLTGEAALHSSEQDQLSIPDIYFDYIFYNNVDINLLESKVKEMVDTLF